MGRRSALTIGIVLGLLCATAHADPSNERLVYTGLALTPPTYLLGVTLHEGSHALAAKLVGGTVDHIRLFPPGVDPRANKFRFGWVYARGLRTRRQKQFFYLAPKITDAIFLSAFTVFALTNNLPDNKYGSLTMTVLATGFWVDFAKDVVLFSRHNDVVKAFNLWCMTGWKQLPARLVYAGISAGFAYAVARGYQHTFRDTTQVASMPLISASF